MSDSELRALLSPAGMELLDSLPEWSAHSDALRSVSRLRTAGHSPELVAAVLSQARLRSKARRKFGEFAGRMLFTEAGLEQASRLRVAANHAARLRASGVEGVVDLGCGIGGDALAFAAAGLPVIAVEADEATAALAAHNLAPFPEVEVRHGMAEQIEIPSGWAVWADPARRAVDRFGQSKRLGRASDYTPSVEWLLGLADTHPLGLKLGPASDRELIPSGFEAQWVEVDGDVVELCLWGGGVERPGIARAALVLDAEGAAELTAAADLPQLEPGALGQVLYDPSGAVIRARLLPLLAAELDAHTVSPGIAYLSGTTVQQSRFASTFTIEAVLSADERSLKRELASRDIGRLEIKKRGMDVDPAILRKRLQLRGSAEATLIMTRVAGAHTALLAHRRSTVDPLD